MLLLILKYISEVNHYNLDFNQFQFNKSGRYVDFDEECKENDVNFL